MSCSFTINDKIVWWPTLRVGHLHLQVGKALAAFDNLDTGVSEITSDDYEIDPRKFRTFLGSLVRYTDHPLYHEMVDGYVAISLVMLIRAGVVSQDDALVRPYRARISAVEGNMAQ